MPLSSYFYRSLLTVALLSPSLAHAATQRFLYVASPGTRNYVEYGGVGLLVFDMDHGYRFVRRIRTWDMTDGKKPENVKGIVASSATGRVYISSLSRIIAIDAMSGNQLWDRGYDGGCDRLAISPDGRTLYVPQLEGPAWHVVNAANGDVIATVTLNSGSHNTIAAADGKHVYLAGLRSTSLPVLDPATMQIASSVGPFDNVIRPFTVNGSNTLAFVNINGLLGFEVGDLRTGQKLYRIVVEGYKQGPVKRHGCPSHGIALTPDEKELWLADCANSAIHIFDASVMPPKQVRTIHASDCVGWLSFSIDGKTGFSSTGQMIDVASHRVVATLKDEAARDVQSEKMLEIDLDGGRVTGVGDQFGIGRK
jgi:DNA-binding beta-propeller fold protein YncE